jgi:hypothetical protein
VFPETSYLLSNYQKLFTGETFLHSSPRIFVHSQPVLDALDKTTEEVAESCAHLVSILYFSLSLTLRTKELKCLSLPILLILFEARRQHLLFTQTLEKGGKVFQGRTNAALFVWGDGDREKNVLKH